jgi:hypothetical protein
MVVLYAYAAVAANVSILFALVSTARDKENTAEKITIIQSRVGFDCT